jgi:hypothetical protein
VRAILEAVEREADAMREEAREKARRYEEDARRRADALLADRRRRISELSDELIARLETLLQGLEGAEEARAAFEGLVKALGDAAARIAAKASGEAEPPPVAAAEPSPPPAPPPEPGPSREPAPREVPPPSEPPRERDPRADGAHIVAIQLAAAGRTRGQAASHIRESLGIADPAPVLDEVFGPGTGEDATVPWARPRRR